MKEIKAIVRKDIPIILAALWDAAQWQESIIDAHYRSLSVYNRTPENTAIAKRADKQIKRFLKLHDRIRADNAHADREQASRDTVGRDVGGKEK